MTTPPMLPSLPGLSWARHKKPGFATRVASHVSGREVRVALMSYPLYEFEVTYNGLPSSNLYPGPLGASDLQTLMSFFLLLQGQFGTFLYADPDEATSVASYVLAVGDGSTSGFLFTKTFGGFTEPVGYVTNLAGVYLNGVLQQPRSYAFTAPNMLNFYVAPGSGAVISASFTWAYQCRFLEDHMDFEEFMSSLWKLDGMKFRSVKANTAPAAMLVATPNPILVNTGTALDANTGTAVDYQ